MQMTILKVYNNDLSGIGWHLLKIQLRVDNSRRLIFKEHFKEATERDSKNPLKLKRVEMLEGF